MTEHEDIELGRCVLRHAAVGCTKSYEMGTLFKNNYHVKETDAESLSAVFKDVAEHSGIMFYSELIVTDCKTDCKFSALSCYRKIKHASNISCEQTPRKSVYSSCSCHDQKNSKTPPIW